jgi:hypothetical protein
MLQWLLAVGIGTLILAFLLQFVFRSLKFVGFEPLEVVAVLLVPIVLGFAFRPIHLARYGDIELFAHPAGFVVPLFLSVRFIASGRAPLKRTIVGVLLLSYVSHAHSTPSHFGVLVKDIGTIVIVTSLYSLYSARESREAGPIAYVSGTLGVIIGADLANLSKLMEIFGKEVKLLLGGAGLFDAVYIVGLFAVAIDFLASSIEKFAEKKEIDAHNDASEKLKNH